MKLPNTLTKRKPDTHKGDYGYALVLGGSPGLSGAVCLCAQAALRVGAGLVTAAVPCSLNNIIETKLTEVMSIPLEEEAGYLCSKSLKSIQAVLNKVDVIALGCGASTKTSAQKLIINAIKTIDKPMVLDADGINAVSGKPQVLGRRESRKLILTPHFGEFSRLIKKDVSYIKQNRKSLAKHFALIYNLILVLKGNRTIVTDGRTIFENKTGNAGMATAGSGDVLTGIIAGLMAQGLKPFEAAKYGVYLHGLSGDLAARKKTQNCLIATDLIDSLPVAFEKSLK